MCFTDQNQDGSNWKDANIIRILFNVLQFLISLEIATEVIAAVWFLAAAGGGTYSGVWAGYIPIVHLFFCIFFYYCLRERENKNLMIACVVVHGVLTLLEIIAAIVYMLFVNFLMDVLCFPGETFLENSCKSKPLWIISWVIGYIIAAWSIAILVLLILLLVKIIRGDTGQTGEIYKQSA